MTKRLTYSSADGRSGIQTPTDVFLERKSLDLDNFFYQKLDEKKKFEKRLAIFENFKKNFWPHILITNYFSPETKKNCSLRIVFELS